MRLALLFNPKSTSVPEGAPDDLFEEYDELETVDQIAGALRLLGATVEPVIADRHLPKRLEERRYDFVFNIAEGPVTLRGHARRCREALPAALCELLEVPFTGSDSVTLGLTLDKSLARRVVSPEVPVAAGVLLDGAVHEESIAQFRFPVIVKPNDEGCSKGIRSDCLARTPVQACALARQLDGRYRCPVLVEEYLPGPEVTVALAGNGPDVRVLGMMEIAPVIPDDDFVYSIEVKRDWRHRVVYHVPPRLETQTLTTLRSNALAAYRLLGCRDIARIDFRLDGQGRPHFLECNPLPGLKPESSDIVILTAKTLGYEGLVQGILLDAMERTGVCAR